MKAATPRVTRRAPSTGLSHLEMLSLTRTRSSLSYATTQLLSMISTFDTSLLALLRREALFDQKLELCSHVFSFEDVGISLY